MSAPHLHLVLNHFPVVLAVVAAVLLGTALLLRRSALARAGLWALGAAGLLAVPVYLSGLQAEETVEELAGVQEAFIEAHEEAGLIALVALLVLGAAALVVLWRLEDREGVSWPLVGAAFVLSLGGAGIAGWTANLGGEIRHPEIRGELFGSPEEAREEEATEAREGAAGEAGGRAAGDAVGPQGEEPGGGETHPGEAADTP